MKDQIENQAKMCYMQGKLKLKMVDVT